MTLNKNTKFLIQSNFNDSVFIENEIKYYLSEVLNLKKINFSVSSKFNQTAKIILESNKKNLLESKIKKGFSIIHKSRDIIIKADSSTDIITGVYYWIEKFLGVRFWGLKIKNEEFITQYNSIKLKDINIFIKSQFKIRGVHLDVINHHYKEKKDFIIGYIDWAVKNGYNLFNIKTEVNKYGNNFWKRLIKEFNKRKVLVDALSHQWINFIPPQMSKSKPDLFPVISQGIHAGERYQYCFSNKEVRDILINKSIEYIEEHPEIDVYPFWPNDGINNWCECSKCRKKSPADWYVLLANELLEKIRKKRLKVKIELIAYCNLVYPPKKIKLKDKDNRVIFLFAPYHRKYDRSISSNLKHNNRFKNNFQFNNMIAGPEYDNEYKNNIIEWKKYLNKNSTNMGIFEYYQANADSGNVFLSRSSYFPPNNIMKEDLKFYKKQNIDFIINCPFPANSFYPNPIKSYITAKIFLLKNFKFETALKEFCLNYYKSDLTYEYFILLEGSLNSLTDSIIVKLDNILNKIKENSKRIIELKNFHKYLKLVIKSDNLNKKLSSYELTVLNELYKLLKNTKNYMFNYFINATKMNIK